MTGIEQVLMPYEGARIVVVANELAMNVQVELLRTVPATDPSHAILHVLHAGAEFGHGAITSVQLDVAVKIADCLGVSRPTCSDQNKLVHAEMATSATDVDGNGGGAAVQSCVAEA